MDLVDLDLLHLQVSDFVADFLDGVGDDHDAHAGQVGGRDLEDAGREHLAISVDLWSML